VKTTAKLNTDNIKPLTSVAETTLKFRTDEVKSQNIRDQILKNSPEKNEDFLGDIHLNLAKVLIDENLLENYSKVRKELFKYSNKLTKKRLCF
jgi:hypothetical protein